MPTYNFKNKDTNEEFSLILSMSEREEFLSNNPSIVQLPPDRMNIVSGVSGITHKSDDGFKESMQRIAAAHPTSELANRYGDKGIKSSKTRQAVEKWRKTTGSKNS